jgi:adenylosuccinate synthase
MTLKNGKINFLIGNSFGSEGKGNVCAYLAKTEKIDIAISNNTPNAGHCFIDDFGITHILKMLPVAGVAGGNPIMILGSGSGINVDRLLEEIEIHKVKPNRLYISPTAVIVDETCKEYERQNLQYISSTFQGSGAAVGLKAMRDKNIKLARDIPELQQYIKTDIPDFLLNEMAENKTILCEICQGYHLSVDSEFYPFCTSRPIGLFRFTGICGW